MSSLSPAKSHVFDFAIKEDEAAAAAAGDEPSEEDTRKLRRILPLPLLSGLKGGSNRRSPF